MVGRTSLLHLETVRKVQLWDGVARPSLRRAWRITENRSQRTHARRRTLGAPPDRTSVLLLLQWHGDDPVHVDVAVRRAGGAQVNDLRRWDIALPNRHAVVN